jgi:hypothetical protein
MAIVSRKLAVPIFIPYSFIHRFASTGITVAQIFSVGSAKLPPTDLIGSQCAEITGWNRMAQLVL